MTIVDKTSIILKNALFIEHNTEGTVMSTVAKKIDDLGRVVIPKKFRERLGIEQNGNVLVSLEEDRIVICAPENRCALCGERIPSGLKFRLCASCVDAIKSD